MAIEALITRLVQEAPALDPGVVAELVERLEAMSSPLSRSLATVVQLVGHGVDPAISLPAIAMACGTLVDPRSTTREYEAARFEIETLLPLPAGQRAPVIAAPDVPLRQLTRRTETR